MNDFPVVIGRRLYDDEKPNGYLEGDRDYVENNLDAAVWFLDNAELLRKLYKGHYDKTQRTA